MCYEFSEWSWKLRAAELARREREAEKPPAERQSRPTEPARPEPRTKEPEKVPA